MAHRARSLALCLCLFTPCAFAAYASATPPSGAVILEAALNYKAATGDIVLGNGIRVKAPAALNVGGRSVSVPVAFKYAANASKVAAKFAFTNPAVMVGSIALAAAYDYYKGQGVEVKDGQWKKQEETGGLYIQVGYYDWTNRVSRISPWLLGPPSAACASIAGLSTGYNSGANRGADLTYVGVNAGQCALNQRTYYIDTNGKQTMGEGVIGLNYEEKTVSGSEWTPVTSAEFDSKFSPLPLTDGVPQALPIPLPVEAPVLNPSSGANPVPQPLRLPQGEPQPVPGSDPPQWKTPVVDVVPSPTPSDPWRVDIQSKEILKTDPAPLPETAPVPVVPPAGESASESPPGLCDQYPDILACQTTKLGTLDAVPLVDKTVNLAITPDTGWGPSSASCPAPKTAIVMGTTIEMPFTLLCDFATGIRPVILALAWLTATLGFIGMARRD